MSRPPVSRSTFECDDHLMGIPEQRRKGATHERIDCRYPARAASGTVRPRSCRFSAATLCRTRACSRCSIRWWPTCPRRSISQASKGTSTASSKAESPRQRRRALLALAFKIATDPFVGKLTFFRVYSGVLRSGGYVYNATKGNRERVGRILQMHANHREEIDEVYAGDIAAAIGLQSRPPATRWRTSTTRSCSSRSRFPSR